MLTLNELPLGVVGSAYLNYGYTASLVGSSKDVEYYRVAMRVFKDIGFDPGLVQVFVNLGESARRDRNFAEAEEHHQEAVRLADTVSDSAAIANARVSLGITYAIQCKHSLSEQEFLGAIRIYSDLNAEFQVRKVEQFITDLRSCRYYGKD